MEGEDDDLRELDYNLRLQSLHSTEIGQWGWIAGLAREKQSVSRALY